MAAFDSLEFFKLDGSLSLSDRPEQLSELYGEAFVAAGPEGTGAFTNDAAFRDWLRGVREGNVKSGMAEMNVVAVRDHPLADAFVLSTVTWGTRFEKTGDQLITFDISYMVNVMGDDPKIVGYFSHESQEAVKQKWGLL